MTERTNLNDRLDVWIWIASAWVRAYLVASAGPYYLAEEYERPGTKHKIEAGSYRRGEKPTMPPALTGRR